VYVHITFVVIVWNALASIVQLSEVFCVCVLCSQASRGALYKIEAFGGTGAVKWTGQLTLYANARLKSRALRMNYIYSLTSK